MSLGSNRGWRDRSTVPLRFLHARDSCERHHRSRPRLRRDVDRQFLVETALITTTAEVLGLVLGLSPALRQRAWSPKLQVLKTTLASAQSGLTLEQAREDRLFWGRLVERAVGAHLTNAAAEGICEIFYWRHVNREVDFVVRAGKHLMAIEVRSGRVRDSLPGLQAFVDRFGLLRTLLVGGEGLPLEKFLLTPVERLLGR